MILRSIVLLLLPSKVDAVKERNYAPNNHHLRPFSFFIQANLYYTHMGWPRFHMMLNVNFDWPCAKQLKWWHRQWCSTMHIVLILKPKPTKQTKTNQTNQCVTKLNNVTMFVSPTTMPSTCLCLPVFCAPPQDQSLCHGMSHLECLDLDWSQDRSNWFIHTIPRICPQQKGLSRILWFITWYSLPPMGDVIFPASAKNE